MEIWSSMYSGAFIYPSKLNIIYYYSQYLILSINNFKIPSIKTGLNSIADGSSERRGILHFLFQNLKSWCQHCKSSIPFLLAASPLQSLRWILIDPPPWNPIVYCHKLDRTYWCFLYPSSSIRWGIIYNLNILFAYISNVLK